MWEECERYCRSKARTNKLFCSTCDKKIPKGEEVVFKINTETEKMKDVYCSKCGKDYEYEVVQDQRHPMDLENQL